MQTAKRIESFSVLGNYLESFVNDFDRKDDSEAQEKFNQVLYSSKAKNSWFTIENQLYAIRTWAEALKKENLEKWLEPYAQIESKNKTIGIVAAGNIPMVGFHDILTVLISGNKAQVKLSSKDDILIPYVLDLLFQIEPKFKEQYESVERLENYDAVIATGSDNTARYFEAYFKKVPNLIRRNRTSVAVLDGSETEKDLEGLAHDMLQYFGLGCRNITKLFLPKGYDIDKIFKALYPWKDIIHHHKYANNYDYFRTIYLMKQLPILENGFVLFKEGEDFFSPISTVSYEYYEDKDKLKEHLAQNEEKIQAVVEKSESGIPFGHAQQPQLWDYADNVDTLKWLMKL